MVRHTYVRKPASAVFDDHEDVQQSESGRHGDKEVTRQNSPRVILQERRPALITSSLPSDPFGMYLPTVRGETRIPSLTSSSFAIRSSPHTGFSEAILQISARSSAGIGGRPSLHLNRPEQSPSHTVPAEDRSRTHDYDCVVANRTNG